MSKDEITQPQEDTKDEETATEQADQEEAQEEQEETIGDLVPDEPETHVEKKAKPETVPIDVYLKLKKELKEFKKSETSTSQSVDSSIEEIANEFDVDAGFAQKLANAIQSSSISKFEERYLAEKKETEYKQKLQESESKLDKAIEIALENSPHYKNVANVDILKDLARKTTDKTMTVSKLLENVYGKAVTGKKTMESSAPTSGEKGNTSVDFTKAGDPAVYAQIKSDPKLYKEYNEFVLKNLNI